MAAFEAGSVTLYGAIRGTGCGLRRPIGVVDVAVHAGRQGPQYSSEVDDCRRRTMAPVPPNQASRHNRVLRALPSARYVSSTASCTVDRTRAGCEDRPGSRLYPLELASDDHGQLTLPTEWAGDPAPPSETHLSNATRSHLATIVAGDTCHVGIYRYDSHHTTLCDYLIA